MSIVEEVEALRKVPLFSSLDDAKLKLLSFTSEWVEYSSGDYLFMEGDSGHDAFVIMEGLVEVYVNTDSDPLLVASRTVGDIIGETAIVCDVPRTASVVAKDRLIVLKISKEVFLQLLEGYPQVAMAVIRKLAMRVNDGLHIATRNPE